MKVLILAGGFATRLWPLTEKRAKPLLLLDGKTILAHIFDQIPQDADVYLLTNKKFEKDFEKECQKCQRTRVQIFCEDAYSDGEKLGALRALSVAIREFKIVENVFVFAGDNLLPELRIEQIMCSVYESCIAVREVETLEEARKFGVIEIKNQRAENRDQMSNSKYKIQNTEIINFEEKPSEPKSRLVSTGFACIGSNLFPILHIFANESPDALGSIFTEFLRCKKTVLAAKVGGEWFDVGSFETYLEAHRKLQKQNLQKDKNVQEKGNLFSGKVFIGEGAQITNCQILDSIIYPGCRLRNCHISRSILDENCDLEGLDINQKLIRKGTILKV
ncbi:NDP-sugar synthase [Candidatus Gracilibacteria bacterium]|nr:NDP-sugar synthase [Candidatus Gracilibacteria bacterium]